MSAKQTQARSFTGTIERGTKMKVTVYFEAKTGAHIAAQFDSEETYMVCLPALEKLAKSRGYIVTESLDFEEATE